MVGADVVRRFDVNVTGRDFVIGDLHGCYDKLMACLDDVDFDRRVDRVFSVGDLIDRGPDSERCLRLVHEPWFFAVMGNHEAMMIDATLGPEGTAEWYISGGVWSSRLDYATREALVRIALELPLAIQVGDFGIVHAEPVDNWAYIDRIDREPWFTQALWGRDIIFDQTEKKVRNIREVYVGHTIVDRPDRYGNVVFIDTGAFRHNGYLTMLELAHEAVELE